MGYPEEHEDTVSGFDRRVTDWRSREELSVAAAQLDRYHVSYTWKYRDGRWAIFRSDAGEDERAFLEERKRAMKQWKKQNLVED